MLDLKPIDVQSPEFGDLYDELPLWSAPFGLRLLEAVPIRAGQTILDVGAGTGFLTIELAQRCYPSRVIAVDPWKVATNRLKKKVEFLGLPNVEIREQDAAIVDLPDNSVDLIVSNLGINNFENSLDVLKTCWRIARPKARIFLTSNLVGTMYQFYDVFREVLTDSQASDHLDRLQRHVCHRATPESLRSQLEQAGFRVARIVTESFNLRFADGTAMFRHSFMRIGFVPAWKEILEPDPDNMLFEMLRHQLDQQAKRLDGLVLSIPMALIEAEKPQILLT